MLILIAAMTTATATMGPADGVARDLRCLVASELLIARAPTPMLQQEARTMMIYFLGRVEAEVAEDDLAVKLSETLKGTPKSAFEKDAPRCANEL